MDHELSPDELESLLAAYAIDAVDDDERRAVEEHLRRSPAAADEVARLREAAAMLAIAGGPPPEGLWEQLEAKLQVSESARPPALMGRTMAWSFQRFRSWAGRSSPSKCYSGPTPTARRLSASCTSRMSASPGF